MPSPGVQLEIDAARVQFQIHEFELRRALAKPVERDLTRRAIRVEAQAKQNATHRPGPNVITGRLRGSITWRLGLDGIGPFADVGSAVHYAAYVELGTSRAPAYPYLAPALEAARL